MIKPLVIEQPPHYRLLHYIGSYLLLVVTALVANLPTHLLWQYDWEGDTLVLRIGTPVQIMGLHLVVSLLVFLLLRFLIATRVSILSTRHLKIVAGVMYVGVTLFCI